MELRADLLPHGYIWFSQHRGGFVWPFVKLSCEDVADQLLFVYANIKQWEPGRMVWWYSWSEITDTNAHMHTYSKYSCFLLLKHTCACILIGRDNMPAESYCKLGPQQGSEKKQITIFTHRNTHTKYVTVQQKGSKSLNGLQTKLGQGHSVCDFALSLSISGWWGGFWLGGQKARSLCQDGKGYKAAALTTTKPFIPFQTSSHSATSLPRSRTGAEGKSNWPPIRLIKLYWIWLIENIWKGTHKTIHDTLESWYLFIVLWVVLEIYQVDEEVNVHLEKVHKTVLMAALIFSIHHIWLFTSACFDSCSRLHQEARQNLNWVHTPFAARLNRFILISEKNYANIQMSSPAFKTLEISKCKVLFKIKV